MIKNFYYRYLLVITVIVGCLFICSVPEASNMTSWMILGATFGILCWMTHKSFKNLSQERINEILMLDFFKKIGCDFSEE